MEASLPADTTTPAVIITVPGWERGTTNEPAAIVTSVPTGGHRGQGFAAPMHAKSQAVPR